MMSAQSITRYMHNAIPLAAAMRVEVWKWDGTSLEVRAPFDVHINHMGTAFGGSLQTLCTLASWTHLHLRLNEVDPKAHLVLFRSECDYLSPVEGELWARCSDLDPADWEKFVRTYQRRGRARISVVAEAGALGHGAGVHFKASFVALKGDPA